MIEYALMYMAGVCTGVVLMFIWVLYIGQKASNKLKQMTPDKVKSASSKEKPKNITDRMKRVREITEEMISLNQASDGPQKNALHGKDKNRNIARMKALEEEKNDILRSILRDGFDPELNAMDESGTITQMKLSEFMAMQGITMEPKVEQKPAPRSQQIGKFTVIRGGKDDGDKPN